MTTTTRRRTRRIAATTLLIADLVAIGFFNDFDTCELCEHPTAELFTRIDNRDGSEVECCEHCADTADVSWCE